MKNILLISHSFPPILTSNSIQISNWVKELSKNGFVIKVLSVNPRYTKEKLGLQEIDSDNVNVHRFYSPEALIDDIKIKGIINRIFPSLLHMPDQKILWALNAALFFKKYVKIEEVDLLISCSHYLSNHIAAKSVFKTISSRKKIPWIACFSDPWTESIYFPEVSKKILDWNKNMEKDILENANVLVFPCEELKNQFAMKHSRWPITIETKSFVIPHSYDRELFINLKKEKKTKCLNNDGNSLIFVHTGSFYGKRSPIPLFKAIRKLKSEKEIGMHFYFIGDNGSYVEKLHEYGIERNVTFIDRVVYAESISYMLSADYLLLIDAPCEGEKSVFFPSKLADYLGTGIKVIGLTPKGSASERILKTYGHTAIDINNDDEIYFKISELSNRNDESIRLNPPDEISAQNVGKNWKNVIESASEILQNCNKL